MRGNLITPKDAARILGVSLATVYGLVASKAISHVRVGAKRGKIGFSEAHLEEYVRRNEVKAVQPPAPHQPLPDWFLGKRGSP